MLRVTIIFAIIFGHAAMAQTLQYLSVDGTLFEYEQNRHGVVLTATGQDNTIMVEPDATAKVTRIGDVIYLGRGCDAFSRKFGDGRWEATEGGFVVNFGTVTITFPGQKIDVGAGDRCWR